MTIVRGFSFTPSDLVTSSRLYDLVANAQFTNVNWVAAMAPEISYVGASSPSLPGDGNVWWEYERLTYLTVSAYSGHFVDFNVMISTPQGVMALFRQNALETKLLRNLDTNSPPGRIAFCQNVASQSGVTLFCRLAWGSGGEPFNSPQFGWIGVNWNATNITAASLSSFPRLTLMGISQAEIESGGRWTLPDPIFLALSKTGGHLSYFAQSAASQSNILVQALALEDKAASAYALAWLYGSPVMRSQ